MIRALMIGVLAASPLAAEVKFADRSDQLGADHIYSGGWEHFVGGGVAVFDCDGDALPEIFAAGGESPARLFRNQGRMQFEPDPNLPVMRGVIGAYPLDIDSDGKQDLVVLRVGPNLILQGQGECQFHDATADWKLESADQWTTAFSATWEPGQDWPTLAFGNYVDRFDPEGPFGTCDSHIIFRPDAQGYTKAILEPGYCSLSMLFSDWAAQGKADLRISNDRHYYLNDGTEQMWRPSERRFLSAEDGFETISIWGMGIASRDVSGDGRPDVYLTSMGDNILQLATKQPGYEAAPFSIGTYAQRPHTGEDGRPSTAWHAQFGDVNNDGLADLFVAKGNVDQMPGLALEDPNNLLLARPNGPFSEVSIEAGVATTERSRGGALVDLNGDGSLDLVVVNRRAPLELYENVTTRTGNYIFVELRQTGANPQAIGAWLELRTALGQQRLEITVGGGHASGISAPHHFGLGDVETAQIRVIWPDGMQGGWHTVEANQTIEMTR